MLHVPKLISKAAAVVRNFAINVALPGSYAVAAVTMTDLDFMNEQPVRLRFELFAAWSNTYPLILAHSHKDSLR